MESERVYCGSDEETKYLTPKSPEGDLWTFELSCTTKPISTLERKSAFKRGGMFEGASPLIFKRAKELRSTMTDAEKLFWSYLKSGIKGFKVRRQHPIGIYVADFYCHKLKLIIELDGSIHNTNEAKAYDKQRQDDLESWGYTVIRFTNEELQRDSEKVLAEICSKVEILISS